MYVPSYLYRNSGHKVQTSSWPGPCSLYSRSHELWEFPLKVRLPWQYTCMLHISSFPRYTLFRSSSSKILQDQQNSIICLEWSIIKKQSHWELCDDCFTYQYFQYETGNITAKWYSPPSDHFPWHSLCCCLVVFTEKQTQVFVFVLLYVCLCNGTASCVVRSNEELYLYVPIYHPTPVYVVLMYI